jgi:hypothetical protein
MEFTSFLTTLLAQLKASGSGWCFLNHYRKLPVHLPAEPIPLLIPESAKDGVIASLIAMEGIWITAFHREEGALTLSLYGITVDGTAEPCRLRLITGLHWQGVPYLSMEDALARARQWTEASTLITAPDPVDELVISFFQHIIRHRRVKDSDWQNMLSIAETFPLESETRFHALFGKEPGEKAWLKLREGKQKLLLKMVPRLRKAFLRESRQRVGGAIALYRLHRRGQRNCHYWQARPEYGLRLAFLGPDEQRKSEVIDAFLRLARGTFERAEQSFFRYSFRHRPLPLPDGRGLPARKRPAKSRWKSHLRLLSLLWLYRRERRCSFKEPVLRIYDSYYYDLIADPRRFQYGGSERFARLLLRYIPAPDGVMVPDVGPAWQQHSSEEITSTEATALRDSYHRLTPLLPHAIPIDPHLSPQEQAEQTLNVWLPLAQAEIVKRMGYQ